MLSLLDKIGIPGLSDVEVFRDHKKENLFYALRSTPVVSRDQDGKPALSYSFFARNADIAYASRSNNELVELQLGQLLVTVDLSLSKEEEKIALDFLRKTVNNKAHPFVHQYYKKYKRNLPTRQIEPQLAYPDSWKEGTVQLEILKGLGETFTKSSSEQVKPSLAASNSAALYATFGIEGSQIMFDALSKGFASDDGQQEKTPIQANVRYELKGYGWIPNLEVKVNGDSSQIYEFMQDQVNEYKKEIKEGRRTKTLRIAGRTVFKRITSFDSNVDIEKEELHELVEKMVELKVITIEITDFGDIASNSAEKQEVENELRTSLMDMIFNTILKNFFETAFIGEQNENLNGEDSNSGDGAQPDPNLHLSERDKRIKNQKHYYHFKSEINKSQISELRFHFKKNGVAEFYRNPSGSLSVQLSESERKAAVRMIDVSSPEVQMLEVQVTANADFETDNIHSIIVNLSYSQKDHTSGIVRENRKSFLFTEGTEVGTFRVTMARNAQKELVDFYRAEAKISYKASADAPPPVVMENISDRNLVISYDRLGFITVKVTAGDIDWTVIKEAVVDLEYMAKPNQPDTKKQIRLNGDSISGNWKSYMYGHEDKKYRYKVKYFYQDGTVSESPYQEDTRENLIINDNLTGRAKATFDVLMDSNTVTSAKVEIQYRDEQNNVSELFSHWFTTSESWDWTMRLREGATTKFQYRYFVQYKDGIVVTSKWKEANSDENIPLINIKRYPQTLTVDGGMLPWDKYRMVYVNVSYEDQEHSYLKQDTLRLNETDPFKSFDIYSFHPGTNTFFYSAKFASNGGIQELSKKEVNGGVLILEDPDITQPPNDPDQ